VETAVVRKYTLDDVRRALVELGLLEVEPEPPT
jgi:hypothetical protein